MYRLTVSDSFSAAHRLCGYEGACRNLHGHNWKVKVCLASRELDEIGMAMDFGEIKRILSGLLEELDHAYLNDLPAFKKQNPTSENLARYIFERFEDELKGTQVKIESVEIGESERSAVVYSHA